MLYFLSILRTFDWSLLQKNNFYWLSVRLPHPFSKTLTFQGNAIWFSKAGRQDMDMELSNPQAVLVSFFEDCYWYPWCSNFSKMTDWTPTFDSPKQFEHEVEVLSLRHSISPPDTRLAILRPMLYIWYMFCGVWAKGFRFRNQSMATQRNMCASRERNGGRHYPSISCF